MFSIVMPRAHPVRWYPRGWITVSIHGTVVRRHDNACPYRLEKPP
jgi:hypothetical protein